MAELSADTLAILDELDRQGKLLRSDGRAHSIKSVKIEMKKFQGVFEDIAVNIQAQTDMMRKTLNIEESRLSTQKKQEELAEIQRKKAEEESKPAPAETANDRGPDGPGLFKILGNALGSIGGLAIKGAVGIGAAALMWQFAKGFIDEREGAGTADGYIDSVVTFIGDMTDKLATAPTIFENLITAAENVATEAGEIVTAFEGVNWTSLGNAFKTAGEKMEPAVDSIIDFFENPLTYILPSIASGVATAMIGRTVGAAALGRSVQGAPISPGRALVTGVTGAVAIGLSLYGDRVKEWMQNQTWSDNEIAGYRLGDVASEAVGVTTTTAQFATIGAMFGPTGIIAGALIGLTVSLGSILGRWIESRKDAATADFNEDVNRLNQVLEEVEGGEFNDEQLAEIARIRQEAIRRTQLGIADELVAEAQATADAADEAIGSVRMDPSKGVNALQIQETIDKILAGDQAAVEELVNFAEGRERETADSFFRFSSKEDFIRDMITNFGDNLLSREDDMQGNLERYRRWMDEIAPDILQQYGYRFGTPGFVNFGRGTRATLHGMEAVVPRNTLAGRMLDANFDDNFNRLERVANAGAGGAGHLIINAPTTLAPNVNNVGGHTSLSTHNVVGGGGGGGGRGNPYGLPSAIN